jgi:hypothetical protein
MADKSAFPRTKGRLTAVAETTLEGRKAFYCECRCGRMGRVVLARSFDRGRVTCCELCVKEGHSENLSYGPERVHVSMDPDVFEALGIDLGAEENVSGALVRSVLRDYAQVVGSTELERSLTDDEWERLKGTLRNYPSLRTVQGMVTALEVVGIGGEWTALERAVLLAKVRRGLNNDPV